MLQVDTRPPNVHPTEERRRQQRVAEISEMIHVASLLHDDVIDEATTRRGLKALNALFGNKVAILAGDFLLARASVTLASLRNTEVIELLSQVIEHLVSGEILQACCPIPNPPYLCTCMLHPCWLAPAGKEVYPMLALPVSSQLPNQPSPCIPQASSILISGLLTFAILSTAFHFSLS